MCNCHPRSPPALRRKCRLMSCSTDLQANKLWQNPINSKKCTYILIYHVFYDWHLNLSRLLWVFNNFVEVLPTTLEFIWRAFSATRRQFNVICWVNSNFSLDVRNMFLSNDKEYIDRKWIKEIEKETKMEAEKRECKKTGIDRKHRSKEWEDGHHIAHKM